MSEKNSVVQSRIRELVKEKDFRVSGEFFDALNTQVDSIVKGAIERAEKNGRKTLQPQDI